MYQIRLEESSIAAIRRIAREQIDGALESLREGRDRNEAVHDARKRCKKLRAVLRLVRDGLGEDAYRAQNDLFRDASRLLSPARDRWVLVETVEALQARYGAFLAESTLTPTRELLRERHRIALERLLDVERADERAAALLEQARESIGKWSLRGTPEVDVVVAGVLRVYKQGRKALAKAEKERTTTSFHDWRKRVKYLWYHSRLLRLRTRGAATLTDRLERLSRQLGEEHDLAVFGAHLRSDRTLTRSLEHRELLLGLVAQRRSDLRETALAMGRRLYARKPGEVASRLERQWSKASRDDSDVAAAGAAERELPTASQPAQGAATVTRFDPARRRSS
ncbi:MAG TPA: CHAD domain-containing protein [Thermoanaerobaculia bacterium]|nr:CHAD domain-containing protein [Thermoanaerobaculia bacterium]